MKLLNVDTVKEARDKLGERCVETMLRTETVGLRAAAGRILAETIISHENIPPYRRSIVDGYAVLSKDLAAAGEMIPSILKTAGEVQLGIDSTGLRVDPGSCIYVPTGGYVPDGADAVVMIEYCESFAGDMLAVSKSVSSGENIVRIGEDISEGDTLLEKGRKLRPQDLGVLAATGVTEVRVFVPWRVSVISTGDELVGPGEKPGPGQIRDINTYTIAARSGAEGFDVVRTASVRDDRAAMVKALETARDESDVVIMSGGSSQGKKDMSAELIGELADSGVLTHGIAAKPGKPTITGYDSSSDTIFIGLPGHPAAALMVYEQTLIRLWREMTCQPEERRLRARVTVNVPSAPGRRTFQLVRLSGGEVPEAEPVFARSGMILPMSAADGYFEMEENREGIRPGDMVDVVLWK